LRDISLLTGEHRMKVVGADHSNVDTSDDGERRGEYRWVPVMSAAQIRAMEVGQVLVMRRGIHVAVGWAPRITERRGSRQVSLLETTPGLAVPSDAELDALLEEDASRSGWLATWWAAIRSAVVAWVTGADRGPSRDPHPVDDPASRLDPGA
jgi:hypothetical protein